MKLTDLAKYFAHGILFSLITVALFFPLLALMLILIIFGSFIGLLIGLGLLFLVVGLINGVLGSFLWDIERGEGLLKTLFHGLVLDVMLLIVSLVTFYLPSLFFPGIATQVVAFVITAPIDGAIGKQVASWFSSEPSEDQYMDMEAREAVPSGADYTQPAPTKILEQLPVCPLCQNRAEWKAYYKSGEGLKPYNIMCSVCHAEWENELVGTKIIGGFGAPMPERVSPAEDILVLRYPGENSWARIYLDREINITTWKEMVKKS